MRVDGGPSESFPIAVRVRQGCVIMLWLFNILMDGCMSVMKAKVGNVGARLKINGMSWADNQKYI